MTLWHCDIVSEGEGENADDIVGGGEGEGDSTDDSDSHTDGGVAQFHQKT